MREAYQKFYALFILKDETGWTSSIPHSLGQNFKSIFRNQSSVLYVNTDERSHQGVID
jgi:hypothetical protein